MNRISIYKNSLYVISKIIRKRLVRAISLAVLLASLLMLISGIELLVKPFPGITFLPIGNVIAWCGVISFSVLLLSFIALNYFAKAAIINSLLWGFISYCLAGNWRFEFSGFGDSFVGSAKAFSWFVAYSAFTLVFPVIVYLLSFIVKRFS
ncbi:hypothetical protein KDU71_12145 [Carboxylicivirga sediminis]|uniref:Uncharacterized protein n=1 Tax=Carboxylicivirga sediminis TaxID=2006564 RepID=A0A941F3T6_9BACT|nr:hypothetical protein [Carboxylicivirga sediminis]MBR8536313.1 hypothetical protein [Carboxylicivirga sediminis]